MSAQFQVDNQLYEIPRDLLPVDSTIYKSSLNQTPHFDNISVENFDKVYNYIVYGIVPPKSIWPVLDFLGIGIADYNNALFQEERMRAKMYQPQYSSYPINTNPHYGLIKLTPQLWDSLEFNYATGEDIIRCNNTPLVKRPWSEIQESLDRLGKYIGDRTLIAGGSIFSALFGSSSKDIDLFLYQSDPGEAFDTILKTYERSFPLLKEKVPDEPLPPYIIESELEMVRENLSSKIDLIRTKNALSFGNKECEVQMILRLYRTPSEILHGFDVDCSSMGYDGENVWMTRRCLSSLINGYNTFNFDRLSSSYEWRLVKYSARSLPTFVPGFDRTKIDTVRLDRRFDNDGYFVQDPGEESPSNYGRTGEMPDSRERVPKLNGIDILVYMEYLYQVKGIPSQTVEIRASVISDYNLTSEYKKMRRVSKLVDHLMSSDSEDNFEEYYRAYEDLLSQDAPDKYLDLYISNFLYTDGIYKLLSRVTKYNPDDLFTVTTFPENLYEGFGVVRQWEMPRLLEFKSINPGEQMTGTFHRKILEDPSIWYEGIYYHA